MYGNLSNSVGRSRDSHETESKEADNRRSCRSLHISGTDSRPSRDYEFRRFELGALILRFWAFVLRGGGGGGGGCGRVVEKEDPGLVKLTVRFWQYLPPRAIIGHCPVMISCFHPLVPEFIVAVAILCKIMIFSSMFTFTKNPLTYGNLLVSSLNLKSRVRLEIKGGDSFTAHTVQKTDKGHPNHL